MLLRSNIQWHLKISVQLLHKLYYLISISEPKYMQWNLFIMDTLGPAISGSFLLLYIEVFLFQR